MDDDFYQLAIMAVRRQLDVAELPYELDDGDLVLGGHRLGLSINFEGFTSQGGQQIAPLDVQMHLDGDEGDRFRVGTLGIGPDRAAAMRDAVAEWHLLAASPVLSALGAKVDSRRSQEHPPQLAGWAFYPGRVGLRGAVPPQMHVGQPFYRALLGVLRGVVAGWPMPDRFDLRSIFVMATRDAGGCEIQAAVNGFVDSGLTEKLGRLDWPASTDAYLYKQLFVLRAGSDD